MPQRCTTYTGDRLPDELSSANWGKNQAQEAPIGHGEGLKGIFFSFPAQSKRPRGLLWFLRQFSNGTSATTDEKSVDHVKVIFEDLLRLL